MNKPTLLCLDDDPLILKCWVRAFKQHFNVVTAEDVDQATSLIDSVDIILSDWNLKTCTSRDFLIRFKHKPVVVVSGRPGEVTIDHAFRIIEKGIPGLSQQVERSLLEALGG